MSSFFAKKWFIKELPSTENKKCITLFLRFTSISATSILKSKVHGRGKHHPYFCNFLFFSFLFFSFFFQFHSTWLWKMEWRWKIMVAWQRVKELLKRFQSSVVGAFDRRYGAREFDFYPQPWIFFQWFLHLLPGNHYLHQLAPRSLEENILNLARFLVFFFQNFFFSPRFLF